MDFENKLKTKLKEGKRTAGAWVQIASPFSAEILSSAGFDWLMLDITWPGGHSHPGKPSSRYERHRLCSPGTHALERLRCH